MALYPLVRPLVFALDAERAHRLTIRALKLLPPGLPAPTDPVLAVRIAGIDFPNPVGLAAGFDKDAEVFHQMLGFGFGFVEVGTLTPQPQAGNEKPRLFRLAEDRAVINRMGFNNQGFEAARARLTTGRSSLWRLNFKLSARRPGIVGINVGANKDSADRIGDYVAGVREWRQIARYLTLNISSPNTPGLRGLQDKAELDELMAAVMEARGQGSIGYTPPPVFLKVAPDLGPRDIHDIATVAMERKVDALIVGNTTISRPRLTSRHRNEAGGLSGAPLKALALERLRDFRRVTGGALPLIAAGGIENGVDAFDRIRAGASLVQIYSALVYHGPGLAEEINGELKRLLTLHGFARLTDAIGTERRD
jgi:dihydroorotate dehydrogenase